ncbi:MAG: hypothetical protein Q9163_001575 [Psora crenata]
MEAAAVALAAEQVVSTGVEAGVIYGVAKPTQPLSATFTRFSSEAFLPRQHHSLTVLNGQAYIFGGEREDGILAGDEVHIISLPLEKAENEGKPDYKCVPSLGEGEDGRVPGSRAGHSAVAIRDRIYVFGGRGQDEEPIEEVGRVWVFNTNTLGWSYVDSMDDASVPPSRSLHGCVASEQPSAPKKPLEASTYTERMASTISKVPTLLGKGSTGQTSLELHGTIFIHGGASTMSRPLNDTWAFTLATRIWSPLPPTSSPVPALCSLVLVNDVLYSINGSSDFANDIHSLPLKRPSYGDEGGEANAGLIPAQSEWSTTTIPSNPLTPGPKARIGGALMPVSAGAGRYYLLYFMGEKAPSRPISTGEEKPPSPQESGDNPVFYSDAWTYGLPPTSLLLAGLKDATRSTIGLSTPTSAWSEVKVEAKIEAQAKEGASGKSHPGPRAWFAVDAVRKGADVGKRFVIWGGRDGRGKIEGDGWIVSLS